LIFFSDSAIIPMITTLTRLREGKSPLSIHVYKHQAAIQNHLEQL